MAELGSVSFPGLTGVIGGEMTISRGAQPSTALIRTYARPSLSLERGTIVWSYGGNVDRIGDCIPDEAYLKHRDNHHGWVWTITIRDRRQWWKNKSINGRYNARNRDGSIQNPLSLQGLCALCMQSLNEQANVSSMPTGVYPPVNWNAANAAYELERLAELYASEICRDAPSDTFSLQVRGNGSSLGTSALSHEPYPFHSAKAPHSVTVEGGPNIYQTALLLEAVGRDNDGKWKPLDQLSYKPAAGWAGENYYAFGGVSDVKDRQLAFETVWKCYRVKSQIGGGLDVPNCPVVITDPLQYVLSDKLAETYDNISPDAVVVGKWWPYSDVTDDTAIDTIYDAPFRVDPDNNIVWLDYPVVKLSTSGCAEEAELYLITSYNVRQAAGNLYRFGNSVTIGGSAGNKVLRHPELFETVIQQYGTNLTPTGVTTTLAAAQFEAGVYLQAWANSYTDLTTRDLTTDGIVPTSHDGRIAQVKYRVQNGLHATTRASEMFEFDTLAAHREERKRRSQVSQLEELWL